MVPAEEGVGRQRKLVFGGGQPVIRDWETKRERKDSGTLLQVIRRPKRGTPSRSNHEEEKWGQAMRND